MMSRPFADSAVANVSAAHRPRVTLGLDLGGRAGVISTELRAENDEARRQRDHGRFYRLTLSSPSIDTVSGPRWGSD